MADVRDGYPRPQFKRDRWLNLNGEWEFEFDDFNVGEKEKWFLPGSIFSKKIQVPYAFQSGLSGIENHSFHDVVWYKREIDIPETWASSSVVLHFGAVDYLTTVWVNGNLVKKHEGGHTPFHVDITDALNSNENFIVIRAEDFSTDLALPRGKQYWKEQSAEIFYTGTTGIWQTVWLEPVNETYIKKVKMTPDIDENQIEIRTFLNQAVYNKNLKLQYNISYNGKLVAKDLINVISSEEKRVVKISEADHYGQVHLWTPEEPNLYTIHFTLYENEKIIDEVESYFGMRKISVEEGHLCLNNRPYYMRLILDQGYFPDGLLTAPTDEDLKNDVLLAKKMGFNGARKHQKLEDPRYLYWCDQLGLLVWGEFANAREFSEEYVRRYTKEWQEVIDRDYNHPSIVAWVPINESWGVPNIQRDERQQQHVLTMYHLLKSIDSSRLVISNDGWEHMITDLSTIHDYHSSEEILKERYESIENIFKFKPHFGARNIFVKDGNIGQQPILVTECGGIAYKKSEQEGWGYSGAVDEEDFLRKLKGIINPLLNSPVIQGFCYTQLVDVEQEINGLLTYERKPKADLEKIREIIAAPTYHEQQFGKFIT